MPQHDPELDELRALEADLARLEELQSKASKLAFGSAGSPEVEHGLVQQIDYQESPSVKNAISKFQRTMNPAYLEGLSTDDKIRAFGHDPARLKRARLYRNPGQLEALLAVPPKAGLGLPLSRTFRGISKGLADTATGIQQLLLPFTGATEEDREFNRFLSKVEDYKFKVGSDNLPAQSGRVVGQVISTPNLAGKAAKAGKLARHVLEPFATSAIASELQPQYEQDASTFGERGLVGGSLGTVTQTGANLLLGSAGKLYSARNTGELGPAASRSAVRRQEVVDAKARAAALEGWRSPNVTDYTTREASRARYSAGAEAPLQGPLAPLLGRGAKLAEEVADSAKSAGEVVTRTLKTGERVELAALEQAVESAKRRVGDGTGKLGAELEGVQRRVAALGSFTKAQLREVDDLAAKAYGEASARGAAHDKAALDAIEAYRVGVRQKYEAAQFGPTPSSARPDLRAAVAGARPDTAAQTSGRLSISRRKEQIGGAMDRALAEIDAAAPPTRPTKLLATLDDLKSDLLKMPDTNSAEIRELTRMQQDLKSRMSAGIPAAEMDEFVSDLGDKVRAAYQGKGAIVPNKGVRGAAAIAAAGKEDISGTLTTAGASGRKLLTLKEAYTRYVVPGKKQPMANLLNPEVTLGDEFYDAAIKGQTPDRVKQVFGVLDKKGQAAVYNQYVGRAVKGAKDPVSGAVDTTKLLKGLEAEEGVVANLRPQDAETHQGVLNVLRHLKTASEKERALDLKPSAEQVKRALGGLEDYKLGRLKGRENSIKTKLTELKKAGETETGELAEQIKTTAAKYEALLGAVNQTVKSKADFATDLAELAKEADDAARRLEASLPRKGKMSVLLSGLVIRASGSSAVTPREVLSIQKVMELGNTFFRAASKVKPGTGKFGDFLAQSQRGNNKTAKAVNSLVFGHVAGPEEEE